MHKLHEHGVFLSRNNELSVPFVLQRTSGWIFFVESKAHFRIVPAICVESLAVLNK